MERYVVQSREDRWIGELAARQYGVVSWRQLREHGVSRGLVDLRSTEGRLMAAVLAHGPGAVLSHRSAAERWNMLRRSASPKALADFDDAPTNRELERLFLKLCRDHGLPRPRVNVRVALSLHARDEGCRVGGGPPRTNLMRTH